MVGTVQQVAGAAGTALFVTIMATVSAATVNADSAAALATGARASFLVVGCLWLLTIVGAAFLPKHDPEAVPDPAG